VGRNKSVKYLKLCDVSRTARPHQLFYTSPHANYDVHRSVRPIFSQLCRRKAVPQCMPVSAHLHNAVYSSVSDVQRLLFIPFSLRLAVLFNHRLIAYDTSAVFQWRSQKFFTRGACVNCLKFSTDVLHCFCRERNF